MKDKYVEVCPYCGGQEMVEAENPAAAVGTISLVGHKLKQTKLCYVVCTECGSIVRTYAADIKKIIK